MILFWVDKDQEEKALQALNSAQKKVKLEIQDLTEQLKISKESIQLLKEQIEQAEDDTWTNTHHCNMYQPYVLKHLLNLLFRSFLITSIHSIN